MKDIPPLSNKYLIAILIVVMILSIIVLRLTENLTTSQIEPPENEYIWVLGDSIMAISGPPTIVPQVLGSLGIEIDQAILLNQIIECESGWRNVCNAQYGCRAGQGVAQLIPTTVKYCETKLGKSIDPFNEQDSLECAAWLLSNEGSRHWGYPPGHPNRFHNGIEWGSYDCWSVAL